MKGLVARHSVLIRAAPDRVWKALTDPDLIRQYLFGTEAISDWKAGSPLRYRGVWEGKSYEDKGEVLRAEPGRLLVTTYWSSMSGLPDAPENYKTVTYELAPERGGTRLTLTQDNNATEEEKNHAEQNWSQVLGGLKKMVEKMEMEKGD
ncbi:MAG: SRPBCC domain-containing protein [Methanomicrobiales archaeon]|nr:SRPBCC domain-containing protein [Methanomicrobiales archaeon]